VPARDYAVLNLGKRSRASTSSNGVTGEDVMSLHSAFQGGGGSKQIFQVGQVTDPTQEVTCKKRDYRSILRQERSDQKKEKKKSVRKRKEHV